MVFEQSIFHIKEFFDDALIQGLLFVAVGFLVDAGIRRSQATNEITKRHFEIWTYFDSQEDLQHLTDQDRDIGSAPLSTKERHFIAYVLNHIFDMYRARRALIFRHEESLTLEIQESFSAPATKAGWEELRPYQDRAFARFIDKRLKKATAKRSAQKAPKQQSASAIAE